VSTLEEVEEYFRLIQGVHRCYGAEDLKAKHEVEESQSPLREEKVQGQDTVNGRLKRCNRPQDQPCEGRRNDYAIFRRNRPELPE